MPLNLTDNALALYGTVGAMMAAFFLPPKSISIGTTGAVALLAAVGYFLKERWVESKPDEWLIIIRNGKMIKAGVGLKTFTSPTDSYVKFPSKAQHISFSANNVTKEMQGVDIQGFAVWSVFREEDGPFRCYKYMEGGDANRNVQAMCESVLRNLIANSTLESVLRDRNKLRDQIKAELLEQFKGWGIWLETVEIKEVTISSDRLFKSLQAEFRQKTSLNAQQIELLSQQQINECRQTAQLSMAQINQSMQTKKLVVRNTQRMKRQTEQATYDGKLNELELKKLERVNKFQLQKLNIDLQQEKQRINNANVLANLKQDYSLEDLKKRLQVDNLHNEITLEKYQIDSTERVFDRLNLRDVKINQFVGGNVRSNLASLLPQMDYDQAQSQLQKPK